MRVPTLQVRATVNETEQPKWWERNSGPNMIDIHSTQEFLDALSQAGDRLVIVEFYGTWCASCRALFPKGTVPKSCFFPFDLSALQDGSRTSGYYIPQMDSWSPFLVHSLRLAVSAFFILISFQKIKDAIEMHNTARCSIGPPRGVGDLNLEPVSAPKNDRPTGSS
ncbi:Thioredoxin-like 2 [Hibiscus syriacus]|uniref:Thioredoxin-like 2 n=1 Tax=Hibiscus syriacus TaxID=106335 RepID=A0A6A2XMK5_HIBSY|nr:Thioredoxin-like 2 [Hibiscus syriacus]